MSLKEEDVVNDFKLSRVSSFFLACSSHRSRSCLKLVVAETGEERWRLPIFILVLNSDAPQQGISSQDLLRGLDFTCFKQDLCDFKSILNRISWLESL